MPDNIRVHADPPGDKTPSKNSGPAFLLATDSSRDITEIARQLAAHGGGVSSLDLAFDLILNDIVAQASAASAATGAAIALNRDGKMVCRATTGINAPDLGVSVEAASGLTGICLKTGAVQRCLDTESDPGVDPETCRRLGARSMLVIPLTDVSGVFGVLQLFSSSPNAFDGQDMATLLRLADQVAENRRAMLKTEPARRPDSLKVPRFDQLRPTRSGNEITTKKGVFQSDSPITKSNEILTAVLFFLVIVAAISLGIAVGWSNGRKAAITLLVPRQSNAVSAGRTPVPTIRTAQDAAIHPTDDVDPSSDIHNKAKSIPVPVGSLVVTENGKVIYRSSESPSQYGPKQSAPTPGARELVHRVEPDYPIKARAQHIGGMVILDVEIAEDGSVANVAIVSGDPLLASAAAQAVKQWQYQPDPGGPSRTRVTLQFSLPVN